MATYPIIRLALLAFVLLAGSRAAWTAEPVVGMNELPIHDAARMGTREDVVKLLQANPAWRDARTSNGATPMHYAALNENNGPLKALLAAGADVNAKDRDGATPLHMAAFATRTAHARLLLEAGADVGAKTTAGRDPLSMARRVRADETAGVISLWILKGCKPAKPC